MTFNENDLAGLLFGFAGHLTTLEKPITLSRKHNAPQIISHLENYARQKHLSIENPNADWFKKIKKETSHAQENQS